MKRFFWIYYGIAILANVIAAIVFREHINFTRYSVYPIVFMTVLIYLAFFNPSRKRIKDARFDGIASNIFKACIPICLIFVFFFPPWAKLSSAFIIFVAYVIIEIYCDTLLKKETDAHQLKIKKMREEQQKREELGEWYNNIKK